MASAASGGGYESYVFSGWRRSLLSQLSDRRHREQTPFQHLIQHCSRMFEALESTPYHPHVHHKFHRHGTEPNIITAWNHTGGGPPPSSPNCPPSSTGLCDKCPFLEKKLYSIQEELTTVHRKKDELSTRLMVASEQLAAKERERLLLVDRLDETNRRLDSSQANVKQLHDKLAEQANQHQLLLDEYETSQIAYNALNTRFIALDKEHAELVQRWMQAKAKDAERLNQENEKLQRQREEQTKKELEQAVSAMQVTTVEAGPLSGRFGPDGASDSDYVLARLPERPKYSLDAHDGEVNAFRWLPSGGRFGSSQVLATAGGDRKVKIWSIGTNGAQTLETLGGSNASVTSIDVGQEYLLASSNDFASRLWTLSDGKLRRTLTGHSNKVLAVGFLGPPSKAVSGSHDRTIKIWDTNRCACTRTLFAGSSCNDLVTRDGQDSEVISGHFDKRIRFWDIRTDQSPNEILLQGRITSLALGPAQHQLLSCDRDDSLKVLDLRMNQVVQSFSADGFKVGCDWTRAAFSPDGEYVTAGSSDGQLFVWSAVSGRLDACLKDAHSVNVNACGWNANGSVYISVDRNKKMVVWGP